MRQTLLAGLPAYSVTLSDGQIDTLCRFGEALIEKNAVMNLTAITEPSAVAQLHFLDCIALLNAADFREKRVIDVGCGAGLPGMPVKLLVPSVSLTLLDATEKKIDFLRETASAMGLADVTCTANRAEEAAELRERFDAAVSRAVAPLNILAELCLPFVRVGGVFCAMKAKSAGEELRAASRAIPTLGGRVRECAEYTIPGTDVTHCAVWIEKTAPTPSGYPRRYAKIKQKPL